MTRALWITGALLLGACSKSSPSAPRDAEIHGDTGGAPGEASAPGCATRRACPDASRSEDAGQASDAAAACTACPAWPPAALNGAALPASLTLLAPASVPPGAVFPVTVRAPDAWS